MSRISIIYLCFMTNIVFVISLKSVTYQMLANNVTISPTDATVCCQSSNALDSYIGSRLLGSEQTCEPLTFSWFKDRLYEPGYAYFIKLTSSETFDVANVGTHLRYELPIEFESDSRIEVHFTLPSGWTKFEVCLLDSVSGSLTDVYSFTDEQILILLKAYSYDTKTEFNQWTSLQVWEYSYEYARSMPFREDVPQVLELASYSDKVEVSVDGVDLYELPHVVLPYTARVLELTLDVPMQVSSVRFYGIEKTDDLDLLYTALV